MDNTLEEVPQSTFCWLFFWVMIWLLLLLWSDWELGAEVVQKIEENVWLLLTIDEIDWYEWVDRPSEVKLNIFDRKS